MSEKHRAQSAEISAEERSKYYAETDNAEEAA
jgi:hypothetical protein